MDETIGEVKWGRITYTVTRGPSDELPYKLRGPRGASYTLMRNRVNPHDLFAIYTNRMGVVPNLPWFTDRNGVVEVDG